MTGLQEIQKFQKHLKTCKKSPHIDYIELDIDGKEKQVNKQIDMFETLEIRDKSEQ